MCVLSSHHALVRVLGLVGRVQQIAVLQLLTKPLRVLSGSLSCTGIATLDRSLPMLFLRMFHRLTLLVGLGEGSAERRLARVPTLLTGGEKCGEKGGETRAGKDILKYCVKGGVCGSWKGRKVVICAYFISVICKVLHVLRSFDGDEEVALKAHTKGVLLKNSDLQCWLFSFNQINTQQILKTRSLNPNLPVLYNLDLFQWNFKNTHHL